MRKPSMPMSMKRSKAPTASVACTDESTRWPVRADWAAIEQPQHDLLAPDRLERCDPDVELATVHRHADLTVLRPTALDDVHVRKHLDARGKRRSSGGGQVRDVAQHTVDPESDAEVLL